MVLARGAHAASARACHHGVPPVLYPCAGQNPIPIIAGFAWVMLQPFVDLALEIGQTATPSVGLPTLASTYYRKRVQLLISCLRSSTGSRGGLDPPRRVKSDAPRPAACAGCPAPGKADLRVVGHIRWTTTPHSRSHQCQLSEHQDYYDIDAAGKGQPVCVMYR